MSGRPERAAAVSRALVGTMVFAVAVAAFSRIPLLPDIGRDLSLTAGEIGLLMTAFGLGRLGMDLPAGRLNEAAPPYVALTGAGVALALSCALLAVSDSMLQAVVASALIGCSSALTNTTGMYAFATATGAARRGASMALFTTALMSGQMVGPALGGTLGSLLGWRPAIAIAASIGVVVASACLLWRRQARRRVAPRPGPSVAERGPLPGAGPPDGPASPGVGPSRRELIALAATPFACFFALAGLTQTVIPVIGDGELGLSTSTIGLAIAAGAALRFLAAWVAGVASDRLSRKAVLVPSLALMALGALALALSAEAVWWSVAIALLAVGSSGISVAAAALADQVPAERLGRELGMFRLVGDLGLLVGPATAAFLYQESGPELAGAASALIFVAAALVAALWFHEHRGDAGAGGQRAADTGELVIE